MTKIIYYVTAACCFIGISTSEVCHRNFTLTPDNWQKDSLAASRCSVIEGVLSFQYLDLTGFSLPDLTMVTDFVIIHRVSGIFTLSHLLPNLRVIRGRQLYKGFAFTVVANDDVQQIGEWNLEILRGSVGFEDNAMLCPGGPNLWQRKTTPSFWGTNQFDRNYPYCYEDCIAEEESDETGCSGRENCPSKDKACHAECTGGCSKPNSTSSCLHCRHFVMNGKCYQKCPRAHYQYMNYTCVRKWVCYRERNGFEYTPIPNEAPQCVLQCPPGYEPNANICVKQKDGSDCKTTTITSANMGISLKGCTIINGNLRFALYERANITQILRNVEKINTVKGYIEVIGASLLYSLTNILPHLREIKGQETVKHGELSYALYVTDNINLRELWNFENKIKLAISGNVYVGYNEMLCPAQVELLSQLIKKPYRLYKGANGKKAQCVISTIDLKVLPGSTEGTVHLYFDHTYDGIDDRWFLGYYIYYRESQGNIASVYEDRDPYFDEKIWTRVILMFTQVPQKERYVYTIKGLKVHSKYVFYLESFSFGQEKRAVQSNVVYVTTLDKNPVSVKGKSVIFTENNTFSVAVTEPKEADVFYEYSVRFQYTENIWDLTTQDLLSIEKYKRKSELTKRPSDDFTNIRDMKKITCDGAIDMSKIYDHYKRSIQINNDIINSFIYNDGKGGNYTHLTLNEPNVNTNNNIHQQNIINNLRKKNGIYVNWTHNEISFSPMPKNQNWTKTGSFWYMTKITKENVLYENLPDNYLNNECLDYEFSLRRCRNIIENCTNYLKLDSPCAQCSTVYSWRKDYEASDDFNITAEIYFVNETSINNEIKTNDHPCASQLGGHQTLEIHWQEEVMARGYNISVRGDTFQNGIMNIWVNRVTADELNYTCYLPINSTDIYIMVSSRRRTRSFSIGETSILITKQNTDNLLTVEVVLWGLAVGVSLLVFLCWCICKSKNENKKTVLKDNLDYSILGPREKNHLRHVHSETDLHKEEDCGFILKNTLKTDHQVIIGRGNFGIVYQETYEGEKVAVKEIVPKDTKRSMDTTDTEAWEEAEICWSLNHELIVKFLGMKTQWDKSRVAKCHSLVFEYIPGGNLKTFLEEQENISGQEKKRIAIQLARALEYLAGEKIVHCDIASRNVLMNGDNIKLCDFGLAVRWTPDCKTNVVRGELPFCSAPECWDFNGEIYLNTDIWSYGILLYEICTRESLFKGVYGERIRTMVTAIFSDGETPVERIDHAENPFNVRIDALPKEPLTMVMAECLKKHSERPFAQWIIDKLVNGDDAVGSSWDSIEECEAVKEIQSTLQKGSDRSTDSAQESYFADDEEAPCLTPEDMSRGMSCISLQCITRNVQRFDERSHMGTSLPK